MIDRYWFGEVRRISPEAPVPVVRMGRVEERQGAAANVAANCVAMGGEVLTLFSPSDPVVKIRVIGKSQQVVRVDFDTPQLPVDPAQFEELANMASVVVFSDYGKGALTKIADLIPLVKGKVLIDPKGHDYARYRGADLVKPNLDEMREMVGGWGSETELEAKAAKLRQDSQVKAILLTRAVDGMTLFTDQGLTHIESTAQEVFDVSGAGDTAIAALAVGLEMGLTLETASRYANKAAGVAVGKFGTAVVSKDEVFN
ncbi:MAG TPA: PfkB family carbohydrate kinase [Nitrososphaera sp.]|nr:PfkB family carbohydrate kinase [Nitrososphaera sp.]